MSKSQGSFTGVWKAASGRGAGSFQVSDTKSADDDSKFIEEMYDKRDENIALRKTNAQKFVDSFYNIGMSIRCIFSIFR